MTYVPVVIVESGGIAVTQIVPDADTDGGTPMTVVTDNGIAVTVVDEGGIPVTLYTEAGDIWEPAP